MFATEKRLHKAIRLIIDVLNILLGLGAVVMAVMTFLNVEKNKWMFPIIFLSGGLLNLLTGVKQVMNGSKIRGIVLMIVSIAIFGVGVFCYFAVK